jgi:hypothetical protein
MISLERVIPQRSGAMKIGSFGVTTVGSVALKAAASDMLGGGLLGFAWR